MKEHAALRYIQSNVAPPDPREVNWKDKPLPFKIYSNSKQIPLSYDTVTVGTQSDRRDSASCLSVPHSLGREQVGQMLVDIYGLTRQCHSVAMFHPMLRYLPREETGALPFYTSLLRPVPSGGALFPCELYLLVADRACPSDRNRRDRACPCPPCGGEEHYLPAGIYHYDVVHHALDILSQGDYTSLLQCALAHPGETPPAYTLLLSSFFWKDGFKYGAFSYRLQGLDIGTVISQSEIITHHAGFSTTIHYQFQDKALNDLLDLDPLHESIYAVIEWRPSEGELDLQKERDENIGTGVSLTYNGQPANDMPLWERPAHHALPVGIDSVPKIPPPERLAPVPTIHAVGTIDASAFGDHENSSRPTTKSIAYWSLPEEIHRASLIEARETFRPLHSLAPIQLLRGKEGKTHPLSTDTPLVLWEARSQRRSATGNFLPTPLTKQQLSQLLRTSMHGTTNDLDGHTDFLQHTLLYCAVHRVQGLDAGIYVYQHEKHELELVRAGTHSYEIYQALCIPNFNLFYMSVSLFPVGNYKSGFQVYGDRWYRMQNIEAGIIAQRLYLAAAALKLGCRATLGFPVPETNKFLGLPDAKDNPNHEQYMGLMQIMIAPESSAHQYYEQSLLI